MFEQPVIQTSVLFPQILVPNLALLCTSIDEQTGE